jgi:hypothetical protein
MPFRERCVMSLREEFVERALAEEEPFRALCRRFEISAPTGSRRRPTQPFVVSRPQPFVVSLSNRSW